MPVLAVPVTPEEHILGPSTAQYTLVQYADLQCPDTAIVEPELVEVLEQLDRKIRLVYRHFPLTDIHPNAYLAAEATEAAGAQGRFWQMRTLLLDRQDQLDRDGLIGCARELGLDVARFERDLDGHKFKARIDSDILSGEESGVHATPCFFLDGEMLDSGLDLFEVFGALEEGDEDDEEDDDAF